MNVVTGTIHGELIEDVAEFFAPMSSDLVDGLVGQYDATRKRMETLASAVRADEVKGVLHYFVEANTPEQRYGMPSTVEALFDLPGAVGKLNAEFWSRALRMTDVIDYMPQKRRDEWFEQIRNPMGRKASRHSNETDLPQLPDFEEDSVRATLSSLLASRAKFFGERVDGLFRALSREHVTNCPQGFNKRMILLRAISSYGTVESSTAGVINDLRCVIAKFMGRDEPKYGATDAVIRVARRHNGQWMGLDGNALRIRIYNGVGTAHLEVHPEMAWRLNAVLASMYPAAIPAEFRTKPKRAKKIKDFELFDRPLPFAVIGVLANMKLGWEPRENPGFRENKFREVPSTRRFENGSAAVDKATMAEAEKVLVAIGGVWVKEFHYWRFDYEVTEVLDQVICSGCIPDHKSHQFYPTPESVAVAAIEQATIGAEPGMNWLEPSAGQGGLADLMPKDDTTCVEISDLHCKILEAKDHHVQQADFLKWGPAIGKFDRIVMNPPFSEGRWQAHLDHATSMLKPGGRLVAILPDTARNKAPLPGFQHEYSKTFKNEFAGTGIGVVIVTVTHKATA